MNKTIFLFLFCKLYTLFSFVSVDSYTPQNHYGEYQIKYVIDYYFSTRYEGQKRGSMIDFSAAICDWIQESKNWHDEEKNKREIELFIAQEFNLEYAQFDYHLEYESIRYLLNGKKAIVILKESHQVMFNEIQPQISKLSNREHIISLRKKNDQWYISYDQYDSEFSQILKDYSKEEILRNVHENSTKEIKILESYSPWENYQNHEKFHDYDRDKAVSYANLYWEEYNPYYPEFEDNDCTNYISQIILSGGAPMDHSGQHQWYYQDQSRPKITYSYSWAVVQDFFYYVTKNSWTGPVAIRTTLDKLQKGDIIQFYSPSKGWLHSIVVVKIPDKSKTGNSSHYLINSHDDDRYHYPLSYFNAIYKRFIHIEGWFE